MFRGGRRQISQGGSFEIPMSILTDNESQLLDGKGIKRQPLLYLSDRYGHGRSFVPVWKGIETNRCENSMILS